MSEPSEPPPVAAAPPGARLAVLCLGLALVNAATGWAGMSLAVEPGFASALFPPSGIALGALLVFGWRLWPGVFLGSLALNLALSFAAGSASLGAAIPACGIALGSTLQALLGWRLLGGVAPRLADLREVARFVVLAGAAACLVAPTLGVAALQTSSVGASSLPGDVLLQWGTWWIGDTLGVLLLTPIVLAFLAEPRLAWRRRRWPVVAPLLVAFALAGVVYAGSRRSVHDRSESQLARRAVGLAAAVRQSIALHAQLVRSTADLFRASDEVSRREFAVFTAHGLANNDALRALEWAPRVPAEARRALVEDARAAGFADYELRRFHDGRWVTDGSAYAEVHFPVLYMEPSIGNDGALGIDLFSNEERRANLNTAARARDVRATPIIALAQGGRGIVLYEPIFASPTARGIGEVEGFTVGVVDVDRLLASTLGRPATDGLTITLDAPGAEHAPGAVVRSIEAGAQTWALAVAPSAARRSSDAWEVWLTLLGALLFCALLAAFLLVLTGQSEQVETLQRRFRATIEGAPIAILMSDSAGHIVLANPAAEALTGYERETLQTMTVQDLVPPDLLEAQAQKRQRLLEQPEAMGSNVTGDLRARRADGSDLAVEVGLSPVEIDGERFLLSAVVDVSERARQAAELAASNEALLRSNQDLSQFAYIASHDLQSPLRSISGFVQLLERRYGGSFDDKGNRWIKNVREGTDRMQALIRDLLEISRIEGRARPFAAVSLSEVMEEVRASLHASIEDAGAQLEVGSLPEVFGDRVQLAQLLTNLIGNAIHYNDSEVPQVELSELETDAPDFVELAIDDNGIGIPVEHRQAIFEVFRRLHVGDKYPGTGIGLAICRKVAERHGGTIRVEDSPLGGSRFVVRLPTHDGAGEEESES